MVTKKTTAKKAVKKSPTKKAVRKAPAKKAVTKRKYTRKPILGEAVNTRGETWDQQQATAALDAPTPPERPEVALTDVEVLFLAPDMSYSARAVFLVTLEQAGYVSASNPANNIGLLAYESDEIFIPRGVGIRLNHTNKLVSFISEERVFELDSYHLLTGFGFNADIGIYDRIYKAPDKVVVNGVTYEKAR